VAEKRGCSVLRSGITNECRPILKLIASNYVLNDVTLYPAYKKPFSLFAKRASLPNWLPEQDSKRTNCRVVSEEIPYHYRWCNKTKTLFRGPKPDFIPKGRIVSKKEMKHYQYVQAYENPLEKALEFKRIMQEESLNQGQLARKLGFLG
jgi:hypothetical protein